MKKDKKIRSLREILNHRDEIISIAKSHGADNIRIFGSFIRGEQRADSDLDLLADIDEGRNLLDQVALIRELEDFLQIKVDIVEPECLHWYIREKILHEAVPL